jgi:hypothetical protein
MVEPSIANYHRGKEKLRAYRESRETYVNNWHIAHCNI